MTAQKKKRISAAKFLKRLASAPFVFLAAIVILLEDWLWDDLARLAASIGRLPIFRQIESFIVWLPPYAALAFFAAPTLLLLPVKLAAIYFISHGRATLGMLTIVAAKIGGTALVARIFTLTRPKLMRIGWFVWLYEKFIAFKARVYSAIKSTFVYKIAHRRYLRFREAIRIWKNKRRGFVRRRWNASIRLFRRRKQEQE
ncbi:MAG TPA: hypothetical protein VNN73_03895 [Blastocatellia bacterium]|nr:hypothetical protein [Blastocatellia bacterium]